MSLEEQRTETSGSDTEDELYYVSDRWYTISINPVDMHQHFGDINRLRKFRRLMHPLFVGLEEVMKFRFNIELSEPRGPLAGNPTNKSNPYFMGPRLHIHGRFKLLNNEGVLEFLLHIMHKWASLGRIEIDTIKDIDVWDKYCEKHMHIMNLKAYTNVKFKNDRYPSNICNYNNLLSV